MKRDISHEFTLGQLFQFSLPSIAMLIITSLYTAIDGIFISRYIGSNALSSINIMLPLDLLACGIGIMLGTGASAILGRRLGQGREHEAREAFSFITLCALVIGVLATAAFIVPFDPLMHLLGASELLLPYCTDYGYILFGFTIPYITQVMFQTLFITAGRAKLAMWLTIGSGILNLVLDWLLIAVLDWGIAGAAWGTVAGRLLGGITPLIYFFKPQGMLYFVRPCRNIRVLLRTMGNGASEMVSNLAAGVTTLLFNLSMMELAGENGVAAMTIVLYTQFVYTSVYLGFSNSAAPIISYHYGSGNHRYLQQLFRRCLGIVALCTAAMLAASVLLAEPLISLFTPPNTPVYQMAFHGFFLFIWNFLFAGFNIFASGLFTALSNGAASAFISCLRTLVFVTGSVLLLPRVLKLDGIWLSIPLAELLTLFVAVLLVWRMGGVPYHYLRS